MAKKVPQCLLASNKIIIKQCYPLRLLLFTLKIIINTGNGIKMDQLLQLYILLIDNRVILVKEMITLNRHTV
jgi:hypothetical protein